MYSYFCCCLCASLLVIGGCANVKVHKVSVQSRIDGTDRNVKGFRYYLNRPYLLVAERVPVMDRYTPVVLASVKKPSNELVFVALVQDAQGHYDTFSRDAEPLGAVDLGSLEILKGAPLDWEKTRSPETIDLSKVLKAALVMEMAEILTRHSMAAEVKENALAAIRGSIDQSSAATIRAGDDLVEIADCIKDAIAKGQVGLPDDVKDAVAKDCELLDPRMNQAVTDAKTGKVANGEMMLAQCIALRFANELIEETIDPDVGDDPRLAVQNDFNSGLQDLIDTAVESTSGGSPAEAIMKRVTEECLIRARSKNSVQAATITHADIERQFAGVSTGELPAPESEASAGAAAIDGARYTFQDASSAGPGKSGDGETLPDEVPKFQVMFLPDFEEQYAIKNNNFQAKTKYRYFFRNGTQLAAISGSYNSTDVPVKIIETVGSIVQAAGKVAKAAADVAPIGGAEFRDDVKNQRLQTYYIKTEYYIEPGVYRLQKSWETAEAVAQDFIATEQFAGLFSEIGLAVSPVTSVLDATEFEAEINSSTSPPAP